MAKGKKRERSGFSSRLGRKKKKTLADKPYHSKIEEFVNKLTFLTLPSGGSTEGVCAPLIFRPGPKNVFLRPGPHLPLSQGVDDRDARYPKVWIRYCYAPPHPPPPRHTHTLVTLFGSCNNRSRTATLKRLLRRHSTKRGDN